ncbi:MAG: radical SAM protein [Dehalococcoidia bacterium]
MPRYEVRDQKALSNTCEVNATNHCNLACSQCTHLSPVAPRFNSDPAVVYRDLATLSESYSVDQVRILGGEPLLHPAIEELVAAVRRAGICETIALVTNGVLLAKAPQSLWDAVDSVDASSYPGFRLEGEALAACRSRAAAGHTALRVRPVETFRAAYVSEGTSDDGLRQQIYSSCKMAHQWRCHTVAEGFFFKCPPAFLLPKQAGHSTDSSWQKDGIAIERGPAFRARLLAYLQATAPLSACGRCLGTAGVVQPHAQLKRSEWMASLEGRAEDLIDPRALRLRFDGRRSVVSGLRWHVGRRPAGLWRGVQRALARR